VHSSVTTSAAVPPLARVGQKGKPKTCFLRMLGIVLGWVLLLLLLLCCEAAIVVAQGTAAERNSRNCREGRPRHNMDGNSRDSDGDTETGWYRRGISPAARACP